MGDIYCSKHFSDSIPIEKRLCFECLEAENAALSDMELFYKAELEHAKEKLAQSQEREIAYRAKLQEILDWDRAEYHAIPMVERGPIEKLLANPAPSLSTLLDEAEKILSEPDRNQWCIAQPQLKSVIDKALAMIAEWRKA